MYEMLEIIDMVGMFGFPIIVTLYLLWERTAILDKLSTQQQTTSEALTLAVKELTVVIQERVK